MLIGQFTIRKTYFRIIHYVSDRFPKILLADTPTGGSRRHEHPTVIAAKTGSAIVTGTHFQQITALIIVIHPTKETAVTPFRNCLTSGYIPCRIGKTRQILTQQIQLLQTQRSIASSPILITGQCRKVMRLVPCMSISSIHIQIVLVRLVMIFPIIIFKVTGNNRFFLTLFIGIMQVMIPNFIQTATKFVAIIYRQYQILENIDIETVSYNYILLIVSMARAIIHQIGRSSINGSIGMRIGINSLTFGSLGWPR